MKKAILVAFLAVITVFLGSCSYDVAKTTPPDNYTQSTMFFVTVVANHQNGFGDVRVYWIASKLNEGNNPFSFGPLGGTWTCNDIKIRPDFTIMMVNGLCYYTYEVPDIKFGKRYEVSAGLDWEVCNFNSSANRWLLPEEQAGCPYFDLIGKRNMAFTAYADFSVTPG
jgi:hypothetical protein